MTMTTDELTALQALLAKMTGAPWRREGGREDLQFFIFAGEQQLAKSSWHSHIFTRYPSEQQTADNFAGIVALVNAADALIADNLAMKARVAELEGALSGAVRAAELALFVIRKQGVMPNGSWARGFDRDMAEARAALGEAP